MGTGSAAAEPSPTLMTLKAEVSNDFTSFNVEMSVTACRWPAKVESCWLIPALKLDRSWVSTSCKLASNSGSS